MNGRVVASAYVATVAALTAYAFSSSTDEHWPAEIAAAVLTLPALVPALPAIYLLGAVAWSFADSAQSGSASSADPVASDAMWPVTLTFTLLMTATAIGNVVLWRSAVSFLRRARASGPARPRARPGTPP